MNFIKRETAGRGSQAERGRRPLWRREARAWQRRVAWFWFWWDDFDWRRLLCFS